MMLAACLVGAAVVFAQPTAEPSLTERVEALAKEAQACGADLTCLNAVQKKMQALSKELTPATGAPATGPSPELQRQMARSETAAASAREALKAQEDDPCYAVEFQKRLAKELHGTDLPWLTCVPLEIRVKWTVDETDTLEKFHGSCEVMQTYPGYLAVERDQHNRLELRGYRMVSPAPQDRATASSTVEAASATLTGAKYYSIYAPRPVVEKSFGTGRVADFSVSEGNGSLSFTHQLSRQKADAVNDHHMQLWGPRVSVELKNRQATLAHSFWQPGIARFGDEGLSREEIETGLRTGKLTKRFPLSYAMEYLKQSGSAEVTILFDHEPGRLRVTPSTPINAEGPDCGLGFHPSAVKFRLKNVGDSAIGFRIDGATTWAAVSRNKGLLEPGASTTVAVKLDGKALIEKPGVYQTGLKFINTSNARGNAQRAVKLTVNETQEWQVVLDGHYQRTVSTTRKILDPGATQPKFVQDSRRYRFDYDLAAKLMIEKKKGKWGYSCGKVTASKVTHSYQQTPANLWKVKKKACRGCAKINQMAGSALPGNVSANASFDDVRLLWPGIKPALEVTAEVAGKCWNNPKEPGSCTYSAKSGTAYYEDHLFLGRAGDHFLPLRNGPYKPPAPKKSKFGNPAETEYNYRMKKLR